MTPEEALRKRWGYDSFKPFQREAVEAALSGRDCLVVLPTGGGKSLCYQLPAAMGQGLVLVVSPLIALMDDQVAAAREAGLAADALHSNLEADHRGEAARRLAAGKTDVLYVSPERLLVGDLMEGISARLVLIAVDEAHCVSHWGHEFRPEYRRLAEVLERFPETARMALTATATPEVQEDVCAQLALREPARLIGHPDRANLIYRAFPRRDQVGQVREVVRRHPGEGGIVYAQTRRDVERLAARLAGAGISCAAYHAGLPADHRRRVQADFVNERLDIVVATVAFGMGIDRSNVRYVVHANTPRSVEHYQQESGRAGRDGLPAECVLLFAASDLAAHRGLARKDGVLAPERQRALERQLRQIGRYAVAPVCRHRLLAEHFGAPYPPEGVGRDGEVCGACDVCLDETKRLAAEEALLTAKKVLSGAWRADGRFGTGHVVNLLMGRADERMKRIGHDALEVFGLLKESGETAVRSWVDQLIVQGFLETVEEREYPLLRITDAGKALCRGEGTVRLGVPAPPAERAKKRPKTPARGTALGLPADEELFECLRRLRRLIAEGLGVPPYVVFHDSALVEMAAVKPRTPEALLGVRGVGERKLERYGAAFLKVISGRTPEAAAGLGEGTPEDS
ncbi:MAG: ATP-dependent DNA helicase RecQ [Candidatus Omnitrophica bacterium CG11_big_fil_rev_8_21_14_0_20_64_10]|nr:MAG: ATP-dependent DNA helicase RecQ [Candidatus Omnitrophica bacterium CG11_big_fil_rev_8_21_14_0_20_64_10]